MTDHANKLHRLAKQLVDSGRAQTLDEAEAHLRSLRLEIDFNAVGASAAHHDALLTTIALARRTFLGGVAVVGDLNVAHKSRLPLKGTLHDAVVSLGGKPASVFSHVPRISIGLPTCVGSTFHVRETFSGWRAGVVPATADGLDERTTMELAPMVASALAVAEAFAHVSGESEAGARELGISLWRPAQVEWRVSDDAPILNLLPRKLWLIGLGHLGQAFLWALGLLPYETNELQLMLQDFDIATSSTESTSILVDSTMVGMKKTRIASVWAEKRGFSTTLTERRFDSHTIPQGDEPRVAFCGLDNAVGRRLLDSVGFDFAVEAGLGSRFNDFRSISIHTFPARRSAAEIWRVTTGASAAALTSQPAYRQLIESGQMDQCGATTLAGVAVGAPWVGAIASALALAELLRLLEGGTTHVVASLDLSALQFRDFAPRDAELRVNPGFVAIR